MGKVMDYVFTADSAGRRKSLLAAEQGRKDWSWYGKLQIMVSLIVFSLLLWQYVPPAWSGTTSVLEVPGVPSFVLKYAPLIWLDQEEEYFPSDIYVHVNNTHPDIDYARIENPPTPLTLDNLDSLNNYGNKGGLNVYLTSKIDIETSPTWLQGVVPDSSGKTNGARSCAIIINDHGSGHVDAYYMYFYAYNLGNEVGSRGNWGNHVGDWEHNMIRFVDGVPKEMWFSQHGSGQAFKFDILEKQGVRSVAYSARGSHANYAISGEHDHVIGGFNPNLGILIDYTSRGTLWDPTLSAYFYNYDGNNRDFSSVDSTSPLGAMNYRGKWGDEEYPDSDPRQERFWPPLVTFRRYSSGPTGPWTKGLNRTKTCPRSQRCFVWDYLKASALSVE